MQVIIISFLVFDSTVEFLRFYLSNVLKTTSTMVVLQLSYSSLLSIT